jgi:uncharacterized protein (UPF0276 family)
VYRTNPDLIKVVEIEPQTLWAKGTMPGSAPHGNAVELRHVSALPQKLLTHGVGNPVGGTICDQERHVPEFRRWTEQLRAPWTSEHLSILDVRGAHGAQPCGFLMPPLQTDAQVRLAATNIKFRASALGKPFAFETGVNYFSRRECEMADGDFFAAVAEAADCGILLDLTNLWANDRNGRAKIDDVLARLPLERVWEVHLAGLEFAHGHWLDAHSNGIDPELAEFALDVVANLPNVGAIVFEISPDRTAAFGAKAFLKEMEKLNRLWDAVRDVPVATPRAQQHFAGSQTPSPEEWERLIAKQMLPQRDRPSDGVESLQANDERTFRLYAWLAASFRRGAIAELLENTTRLLLIGMGEAALRDLMDRYVDATPPVAFPSDEALSFRRYVEAHPVSVPGLEDILRFESALVEAAADDRTIRVDLSKDMDAMLADIAIGQLPGPSSDRPGTVLEVAVNPVPSIRALN